MNYEVTYAEGVNVIREKVEGVVDVRKTSISIEFSNEKGALLIVNNRDFMSAKNIDVCGEKTEKIIMGTVPIKDIPKKCNSGQTNSGSNEAVGVSMSFGQAIEALKAGEKVARKGWNGKGMFVYYVPAATYPPATNVMKNAFEGEHVPYREYLALKTAQNDVATWSPSTSDALAEDWEVVE